MDKYQHINNYKKSSKFLLLLIKILFFIKSIEAEITECPRDKPISKLNDCKLDYCSKAQFDSKDCEIKNSIIETQWLNNIIVIGDQSYRYINFGTYSNGDMVIESTCYPGKTKRMFYGLKQNGRPFFINKNNNEETPYYSVNVEGQDELLGNFEAEGIIIKDSNNGKEYFFSVSKLGCYAEIFDFDNDKVYYKKVSVFSSYLYVNSLRNSLFSFPTTDLNYYYFFGFTGTFIRQTKTNIYFQKSS